MRNESYAVLAMIGVAALIGCGKKSEPTPTPAASVSVSSAHPSLSAAASAMKDAVMPFEGEITVSVKDETANAKKLPATITYDVKGDKIRYIPDATSIRAVDDTSTAHAFAIDDSKKSYREVDTKPADKSASSPPDAKINKSQKSEKVAGMDCEDWSIDSGDEKVDACVAKGIAYFDLAQDPKAGAPEPSWAAALTKEKAFPMRLVVHDKAGKEQFRAEATKVDRRKLDDAMFQLPTGFAKKSDIDVKPASLP